MKSTVVSRYVQVHRSSKLLSRHSSRPAPPSSHASDSSAALAESRCCPLHAGRPLEYYCTDDDVAVCSHCSISGEHKGHTVEALSDRVSHNSWGGSGRVVYGYSFLRSSYQLDLK